MNEIYMFNIAKLAVKSLINVASIHPKPGLITPMNNSALDGTDFPCFVDGAMSLFQCFVNCASAGADTESLKPEDAFTILRSPARVGSVDSLLATRGRLQLKGNILCLGLLCAAAGRLLAQNRILTPGALSLTASSFAQGITERELWPLTENSNGKILTAGERAYMTYGLEGCRGEVERGYVQTMKVHEAMRRLEAEYGHLSLRERVAHVVLMAMSENQDTNLAANGGICELMRVQDEAKRVLDAGGMLTPGGVEAVCVMDEDLRRRGTAPSGSVVVVGSAMMIRELVKMKLTRSGYEE